MEWYAELLRRNWYKIVELNMTYIYRKKLYNDWHKSLSEEQKETLRKRQEEKEQKAIKDMENTFFFFEKLIQLYENNRQDYIFSKYHGVYNSDGTLNKDFIENL